MNKGGGRKTPLVDRFWTKVEKSEGCWLWRGFLNNHGYGQVSNDSRRLVYAHRVTYEWANGPIQPGLVIDHICHTPACVRPDHLRAITQQQNSENRGGLASNNVTGFRGVTWNRRKSRYVAQVKKAGRNYYGGSYATAEEAAEAAVRLRNLLQTHNDLDRMAG